MAGKVTFWPSVGRLRTWKLPRVGRSFGTPSSEAIQQMWPGQMRRPTDRNPDVHAGNLVYVALQRSFTTERHAERPQIPGHNSWPGIWPSRLDHC